MSIPNSLRKDRLPVVLVCENGHDHLMSLEQAIRLSGEPCIWCKKRIWRTDVSVSFQREAKFREQRKL